MPSASVAASASAAPITTLPVHDAEPQREPGRQQEQQQTELQAVQALLEKQQHGASGAPAIPRLKSRAAACEIAAFGSMRAAGSALPRRSGGEGRRRAPRVVLCLKGRRRFAAAMRSERGGG